VLRAMIVDDEMLLVKQLKKILVESGEIETCHVFLNPLEAYEFAKSQVTIMRSKPSTWERWII
jgi:two-component system LytT family response regulator